MTALTRDYLLSVLRWDGRDFYWLPREGRAIFNGRHAGRKAGAIDGKGYVMIEIHGRGYGAHRLVWLVETGQWPKHQIDHINGNPSDNRIENLRDVPQSINLRNKCRRIDNKSGCAGVNWNARQHQWIAQARCDGVRHYFGAFRTKEEAIAARKAGQTRLGFTERHGVAP